MCMGFLCGCVVRHCELPLCIPPLAGTGAGLSRWCRCRPGGRMCLRCAPRRKVKCRLNAMERFAILHGEFRPLSFCRLLPLWIPSLSAYTPCRVERERSSRLRFPRATTGRARACLTRRGATRWASARAVMRTPAFADRARPGAAKQAQTLSHFIYCVGRAWSTCHTRHFSETSSENAGHEDQISSSLAHGRNIIHVAAYWRTVAA